MILCNKCKNYVHEDSDVGVVSSLSTSKSFKFSIPPTNLPIMATRFVSRTPPCGKDLGTDVNLPVFCWCFCWAFRFAWILAASVIRRETITGKLTSRTPPISLGDRLIAIIIFRLFSISSFLPGFVADRAFLLQFIRRSACGQCRRSGASLPILRKAGNGAGRPAAWSRRRT